MSPELGLLLKYLAKVPILTRFADGGITDKNEQELLQLGNAAFIAPPPSSAAALGMTAIWTGGSAEPNGPLGPGGIGGAQITSKQVIQQARSRRSDHPENLCINLNPPIQNPLATGANNAVWYDLKVRATWGVGADKSSAVVDVLNGAQFSVVATELVIEGLYTIIDPTGGTPIPIELGSSIGLRARSGSAFGPSFTSIITAAGVGKIVNVAIPSYAKAVTVYPSTTAGAPVAVTIGFVQSTGAAGSLIGITQAANGCPCTYPLPNDIVIVKLTFANADDVALVRFDLAL